MSKREKKNQASPTVVPLRGIRPQEAQTLRSAGRLAGRSVGESMSGPGDRASKIPKPCVPTPSLRAEGHERTPINAEMESLCTPRSWSSARSHMPFAREPGDLGEALASVVDAGQLREGEQPKSVASVAEESDAVIVPEKSAKTWVTPVESMEGRTAAERKSAARNASSTALIRT